MNDALYGLTPDATENFGINLGALAPRGERNVLVASLDALLRVASNPFFPYMIRRIEDGIDSRGAPARATTVPAPPGSMSDDEASAWSFSSVVTFLSNLMGSQSDPPPESP
jgi:hypothetical protein